jgi:redox-sensitive bicupin YhaK (pirin superfamily)
MLKIRKSQERGLADHGWLKSRHTFSFADYYDPRFMGYRTLKVINEDRIAGGTGFDTHPHRDMEIISYVISGSLQHKDSMGNETTILPDEVQVMSAGTGVKHSEYNASETQESHFLQIWILPSQSGIVPRYGQKSFKEEFRRKNFVLVASEEGREGSIGIHQDANVYIGRLKVNQEINFPIHLERSVWIQVIEGELEVNGLKMNAGDGLSADEEKILKIKMLKDGEFILFDLS